MIDWSATGAMLGGIGAISAAIGSIALISLTARYVRINAALLQLNERTLNALQESVDVSRRMAEVSSRQLEVAAAEVRSRIEREHAPFRDLLWATLTGLRELREEEVLSAVRRAKSEHSSGQVWSPPKNYMETVELARTIDPGLHAALSGVFEQPAGAIPVLRKALGQLENQVRALTSDGDCSEAVEDANDAIDNAIAALTKIAASIDGREGRIVGNVVRSQETQFVAK